MDKIIRIKRSATTGAPTSLRSGELAYSESTDTLYIGKGNDGNGNALAVITVGGFGTYLTKAGADAKFQTLSGMSAYYTSDGVDDLLALKYDASNPSNFQTPSQVSSAITAALADYLKTADAELAYYPLSNPSNYISGVHWGQITGTVGNQTDLADILNDKYNASNPAGYQTASQVSSSIETALTPYLTSSSAASTYYPQSNPSGYQTSSQVSAYVATNPTGALLGANNLSDLANKTTARDNLELGEASNVTFNSLRLGSGVNHGDIGTSGISFQRTSDFGIASFDIGDGFFHQKTIAGVTRYFYFGVDYGVDLSGLASGKGIIFPGGSTQTTAFIPANYYTKTAADAAFYPLSTNPAGYLVSSDLTSYATQSFVTSQGYITSAALSPYLTTSSASATYQTISGMSAYLTTSSAASTYYLATNPAGYITSSALSPYLTSANAASTYQTISGMSSYLTTSAASSTYYLATNPSGYITSSALSPYLLSATAASTYYLASNPSGYITSSALSPYLTSATAASTYQTQSGMSSYLTTASAASTYQTISGMSSYLTTSSAASTYQTQSGMSSYLTTASASATYQTLAGMSGYFLTANLATDAQAQTGISTTTAVTPASLSAAKGSCSYFRPPVTSFAAATSGTGASVQALFNGLRVRSPTSTAGYGIGGINFGGSSRGVVGGNSGVSNAFDWSKRFVGRFRCQTALGITDANAVFRVVWGKANNATTGDLTSRGLGIKIAGAGAVILQVHNGTTLTSVTSSFTPNAVYWYDYRIVSDGAGNVTLYVNDSLVATATGGPTTGDGTNCNCMTVEAENLATITGSQVSNYVSEPNFEFSIV